MRRTKVAERAEQVLVGRDPSPGVNSFEHFSGSTDREGKRNGTGGQVASVERTSRGLIRRGTRDNLSRIALTRWTSLIWSFFDKLRQYLLML